MKKALLSLAVIAASGAYVAYEHLPAIGDAAARPLTDASLSAPALASAPRTDAAQATTPAAPATPAPVGAVGDAAVAPATAKSAGSQPAAPLVAVAGSTTADSQSTSLADAQAGPAVAAAWQDQSVAAATIDAAPPAVVPLPPLTRPSVDAAVTPATSSPLAQTATQPASGYRDGTFTGISANAYYGDVQVAAVIKGGQLTSVKVLDYPSDRRTSQYINSRALPALRQEAVQAQSADIDTVSGATLTSEAFIQSLDAALSAARNGGNNA